MSAPSEFGEELIIYKDVYTEAIIHTKEIFISISRTLLSESREYNLTVGEITDASIFDTSYPNNQHISFQFANSQLLATLDVSSILLKNTHGNKWSIVKYDIMQKVANGEFDLVTNARPGSTTPGETNVANMNASIPRLDFRFGNVNACYNLSRMYEIYGR